MSDQTPDYRPASRLRAQVSQPTLSSMIQQIKVVTEKG